MQQAQHSLCPGSRKGIAPIGGRSSCRGEGITLRHLSDWSELDQPAGCSGVDRDGRTKEPGPTRYVPTLRSYRQLVYAQGGTLMAAPFDLQRLALAGSAVPVVDSVLQSTLTGAAQYSFSSARIASLCSGRRTDNPDKAGVGEPQWGGAAPGHPRRRLPDPANF